MWGRATGRVIGDPWLWVMICKQKRIYMDSEDVIVRADPSHTLVHE